MGKDKINHLECIKIAFKMIYEVDKNSFAITIILSIVSGVFPFLVLKLGQTIINIIQIHSTRFDNIIILILIYLSLQFISVIVDNIKNYYLQRLSNEVTYSSMRKVMGKCADLPLKKLEDNKTYDILNRIEQDATLKPYEILMSVINLLFNLTQTIIAMYVLIKWNYFLVILLFAVTIISVFGEIRIGKLEFNIRNRRSTLERKSWYYSFLLTHDIAFKEIKTFRLKNYFISKYKEITDTIINQNNSIEKLKALLIIVINFFQVLINLYIFKELAFKTYNGEFLIGTAMVYISTIVIFQGSLNETGTSVYNIINSNLYINLLKEFLEFKTDDLKEETKTILRSIKDINVISLSNINFSYDDNSLALQDISLKIKKGESIAIIGENGSGKSTLLKILAGLYSPDSGVFLINGMKFDDIEIESYRTQISSLFQDYLKYEGTIKENIILGQIDRNEDDFSILTALNSADAKFLKNDGKYNINKVVGNWFENGQELSGGQWQKIAIARTMYRKSSLLLFDEPSSSLDI
ncbi:MAG: ABC transporter ATP-binding protein, partial [Anaerococcus vaginalis]|nr:ABC transporter ATP-binding protein [Anaerococcus vaginalis]